MPQSCPVKKEGRGLREKLRNGGSSARISARTALSPELEVEANKKQFASVGKGFGCISMLIRLPKTEIPAGYSCVVGAAHIPKRYAILCPPRKRGALRVFFSSFFPS